ncbi:hypothetical protein SAMN05421693_1191 [Ectothiorhodospira magna]|uniref:Uncharacterized protein n=1 Tax=Ectothiorhodospira magna TaxID=867345 RepID=A0A1H9DTP9_9GAMM|nr:hypothetical protein SAMN05421693_1191 [Ectothiorhodospira magna]
MLSQLCRGKIDELLVVTLPDDVLHDVGIQIQQKPA